MFGKIVGGTLVIIGLSWALGCENKPFAVGPPMWHYCPASMNFPTDRPGMCPEYWTCRPDGMCEYFPDPNGPGSADGPLEQSPIWPHWR